MIETIQIRGERLDLLPEKAIYWEDTKTIFIADLHIGKAAHFRKNGIPVPARLRENNLWRLAGLILDYKPERVIFLGDLFHSAVNKAWNSFEDFLDQFTDIEFILIKGNHDILPLDKFESAGIVVRDDLILGPFLLTHDRVESEYYNLHGHIHPGIRLRGTGRQSLVLPCFFFAEAYGILPSFGEFTGLHKLNPKKSDRIFVATPDEVVEVS